MFLKDCLITAGSYIKNFKKRKTIRFALRLFNKKGIEIGGPSVRVFSLKSFFPAYIFAKNIDGVNFSSTTVWEGNIREGLYNYYRNKKGYQYISETTDLSRIDSAKYDFLLSSHCLEHVANPLKALKEWNRVLKRNAMLVLVLPDKNFTFDKRRPYTTFEHLRHDYKMNISEEDNTHFDEINTAHDIETDDGVENIQALKERTTKNYLNRCAHHHIFNFKVITEMLDYCGFTAILQQKLKPFHLFTIAVKR